MPCLHYSDKGAPVNVAGRMKVGYRGDIIHTDHVEANNRVGCTSLQKISVRGMKIETLRRILWRGISKVLG